MEIAVIGAGSVGRTLGNAWQGRGPAVTYGQGTQEAVASCGDLSGKVLVDCTNPLTPDFAALEIGHTQARVTPRRDVQASRGTGNDYPAVRSGRRRAAHVRRAGTSPDEMFDLDYTRRKWQGH